MCRARSARRPVARTKRSLSPQSRSLALSMILRGSLHSLADLADDISQCCLLRLVWMWCEGKRDFGKAALEARKDLVDDGRVRQGSPALADRLCTGLGAPGGRFTAGTPGAFSAWRPTTCC